MLTDIIKTKKYREFKTVTFIGDWLFASIAGISLLCVGVLTYSFFNWQSPVDCVSVPFFYKGIRVMVIVAIPVSLLFNKASNESDRNRPK